MIAKLIVHAPTRQQAITTMALVLQQTVILGIVTNQKFLLNVMRNARFQSGVYDTGFIAAEIDNLKPALTDVEESRIAVVGFMFDWAMRNAQRSALRNIPAGWRNNSQKKFTQKLIVEDQDVLELEYEHHNTGSGQHKFVFGVTKDEKKQDTNRQAILNEVKLNEAQMQLPGQHLVTGLLVCTIGMYL
jgi:3-methylcrotonyl-CoA carboxylase alpha subunit